LNFEKFTRNSGIDEKGSDLLRKRGDGLTIVNVRSYTKA
jgi:hypothetical protein